MLAEARKRAKILIVDDQEQNVRLLQRLLQHAGYTTLESSTDPRRVLPLFSEFQPDLILLDLMMPDLDGFGVMRELASHIASDDYLPILVLTADVTPETKRRALSAGAKDFLTKPFDRTEVVLRIENLLHARFLHRELQRQNEMLEEQVRDRTQQFLQSEKLAAMGSLLAGVAHELNNPLSVVMGRAALLRQMAGEGPTALEAGKIAKAAERCARIVKNFLALARQQPMEHQTVSLNRVVEEAVELLAYPLRIDSVETILELAPDLPDIWADPHQLHQVVVNLVSNAHQAMRAIETSRRIILNTRLDAASGRVQLEVADTGPGIPADVQRRIFEPFFTTKPIGQGTGLGLSLCQGIVERHGGAIRVASRPDHGASFFVQLPIDVGQADGVKAAPAALPSPISERTVLIVDDDRDVAETLRDFLGVDGHAAEIVANGTLALEKLEDRQYDVILSEVKMAGLDGPRFYAQLERRHPECLRRVAFVTGDTLSPETTAFLERTRVPTMAKPFTLEQVRQVLQQVAQEPEGEKRSASTARTV
jgi:two-component system NtrC family sensor kinase